MEDKSRNNYGDIIGTRSGKLVVKEYVGRLGKHHWYLCDCDCGTTDHIVSRGNLITYTSTKSCGCGKFEIIDPLDVVGNTFGNLTVIDYVGKRKQRHRYECRCSCGNIVTVDRYQLGISTSCRKCYIEKYIPKNKVSIGERYGFLTVLGYEDGRGYTVRCKCDCGNETNVKLHNLTSGVIKSCGCYRNIDKTDIIGNKYGKLTVSDYSHRVGRYHHYVCTCECGNLTTAIRGNLMAGGTRSCGCIKRGRSNKKKLK
ncbi:MAG: hypothetical protein ACRCX2_22000 [Paraclostridium sp.]